MQFFDEDTEPEVLAKGQTETFEDASNSLMEELRMVLNR